MAFLGAFFKFILSLCEEDKEMFNFAKEIDELSQENTKIENQLEALDREHSLLQNQLYNTEFLISIINDQKYAINQFQQIFVKIYHDSVDIKKFLHEINFTKILQCHHIEMEKKLHQEWQPLQEPFMKTVKLQEQMEQRSIVQKYLQKKKELEKFKEDYDREKETMQKSYKQSMEQVEQATGKRNELIVNLIKQSKEMAELKEKLVKLQEYEDYIEELKQKKLRLSLNLEQKQLEAFNPNLSTNTPHRFCSNSSDSNETSQILMPQLPSFAEILKSFKHNEKKTNITTIENTTEICIKSILHNSNNNQSITTKQTKNVRFKVQLESYQEETTQAIYSEEMESETDIEIETLTPAPNTKQLTDKEINESCEEKENLQEMQETEKESEEIETIDLLTQVENVKDQVKETEELVDITEDNINSKTEITTKSPIHIQECIVLKTPYPIQEVSNPPETESDINTTANCSKQTANSLTSSSSHSNIKDLLNKTKKSFFEDFLNISTNSEHSPSNTTTTNTSTTCQKSIRHKKKTILKDFETFFNENNEFLFSSKDSGGEEEKLKDVEKKFENNKANVTADGVGGEVVEDFLDFGANHGGFVFDSDDNMTMSNKFKSGDMDFM